MEVILREHVDNLGRRGEIVKVADGYARNYLLPRKLALLATDGNKKEIERERAKFDAKEAEEKKVAEAIAARLAGVEMEIARGRRDRSALRVGDQRRHRGALAAKGFDSIAGRSSCTNRSRSSASTPCRSSCTATLSST